MRDIQLVLERWGAWSRHRYETDYSPIAAGFKGLLPEDYDMPSCSDADGLIIDSCLGRLKSKKPNEYQLLHDHYVKNVPKRAIARQMKKSEGMIRITFQLAEGFIEGCLCMKDVKLDMDS